MQNKGLHRYGKFIILLIAFIYFPSQHSLAQFSTNIQAQVALSQPLTVKWLYESEFTINLTPATDGERLYLPLASGLLVSLRAADGQLLWKADLGGELSSSPIADENSVYVASETVGEPTTAPRANGALRALRSGRRNHPVDANTSHADSWLSYR